MFDAGTILRLFISQVFALYFLFILIPLNEPQKKNTILIILSALFITAINAILILNLGITFYIRFYILTLTLPYIALFLFFSVHKGGKLIFALLTVQVIGNVSIINGLYASYALFGENTPYIDTIARVITYLIFLPIAYKYIRPTYLKMVDVLNKGWWVLNFALLISYTLAYFILFVPNSIFVRPEYFIHGYIGIGLSLSIYVIIFFLFVEVQSKIEITRDKDILSSRYTSLEAQSAEIKTIAYKDALTGVNNRYSLYRRMDQLIENKQNFLVVFVDLDNLKEINDTYNHTRGDLYLKQFALAALDAIEDIGDVYRFAGDEFVCLIMHDYLSFSVDQFRVDIAKNMISDVEYQGLSLGLASYPNDGNNSDDLISLADQAMYTEKKSKKIRR